MKILKTPTFALGALFISLTSFAPKHTSNEPLPVMAAHNTFNPGLLYFQAVTYNIEAVYNAEWPNSAVKVNFSAVVNGVLTYFVVQLPEVGWNYTLSGYEYDLIDDPFPAGASVSSVTYITSYAVFGF